MGAIWFLVGALALTAVGTVVVTVRHREPRREDSAMEAFRKEMRALSPEARRATDTRLRPLPRDRSATGE